MRTVSKGCVLARSRKTAVRGIVEPRLRPSTVVVAVISATLGTLIIFNIFFGQDEESAAQFAAGTRSQPVTGSGKQSRSITLKYDAMVEDVQRELLSAGYFQGLVDGVNGPRTRLAVERYQSANGIDVSGEVSKSLLEHIRYTRKITQASDFTGSLDRIGNAEPRPLFAPKPQGSILDLQERLARLGYDPGSRSGAYDEGTRTAILIFQMDRGIAMDGRISASLLAAVKQAEMQKSAQ